MTGLGPPFRRLARQLLRRLPDPAAINNTERLDRDDLARPPKSRDVTDQYSAADARHLYCVFFFNWAPPNFSPTAGPTKATDEQRNAPSQLGGKPQKFLLVPRSRRLFACW